MYSSMTQTGNLKPLFATETLVYCLSYCRTAVTWLSWMVDLYTGIIPEFTFCDLSLHNKHCNYKHTEFLPFFTEHKVYALCFFIILTVMYIYLYFNRFLVISLTGYCDCNSQ